jgi:hypothetical protein
MDLCYRDNRPSTIGTSPCAASRAPKPSRFPIRVLPTAPGNALWISAVPTNVGYWGKSGKHVLDLRFTAFDPKRTSPTSDDISSDLTFTVFQLFSLAC